MAKPDQSVLIIEPQNELKFQGPFVLPLVSFMKLINVTDKKVYYKLKTTAPKKYCVRPNSGVISGKGLVEVQVVLQPFNFNASDKHKHKFMVQFMIEPEGCSMTADDLWKSIAPDKIMNYKLKCVFEMPPVEGNEILEPPGMETNPIIAEEKVKKIVDNNKTSAAKTMLLGNGGELQKVAADLKQMMDEETKLREENLKLKEEITRLQQKLSRNENKSSAYTPPATQHGRFDSFDFSSLHYVIFVLVAIFAYLFGKLGS